MANVINMGGGGANVQSKTVKSSQTQQTINPPEGVDGFNPVIVSPFTLQSKTANPSTVQQTIKPDTGVDALNQVFVSAAPLQEKIVNPSSSQQIITPDKSQGYYGLSKVTVKANPTDWFAITYTGQSISFTEQQLIIPNLPTSLTEFNQVIFSQGRANDQTILSANLYSGFVNGVFSWLLDIQTPVDAFSAKCASPILSQGTLTVNIEEWLYSSPDFEFSLSQFIMRAR